MLIVDNEVFSPSGTTTAVKDYKKWEKAFKETHPHRVTLIRTEGVKINKSGHLEPVPPITIPLLGNKTDSQGHSQSWIYAEFMPKKKDGVFTLDRKSLIMYENDLSLDVSKELDKIYFLTEISSQYGRDYVIYDPAALARERATDKRRDAAFLEVIWGESSPLADDETLRQAASSWGITGTESKDANIIREELEAELKRKDEAKKQDKRLKGSKEFFESIGSVDDTLRKRALIQRGLDKGYIEFIQREWYYVLKGEGEDTRLVYVQPDKSADKFNYFCSQLLNERNEKMWSEVKQSIIDQDYINQLNRMEHVRWICKEAGISQQNKSLDALKEELKVVYTK